MIGNIISMTDIGIIEDDASVRRAISRLLRSNNYKCVAYESAEAALAAPELRRMHCLVVDIELPGLNGFAFRDRLRALDIQVPLAFVTAHSEADFLDWTVLLGDSLCLKKPVDEETLLASISKLLSPSSGLTDL